MTLLVRVVLVATVCSSLAACGANPPEGSTSGVGDAFADRALEVCRAALAEKEKWPPFPVADFDPAAPDPSKFPEVSA